MAFGALHGLVRVLHSIQGRASACSSTDDMWLFSLSRISHKMPVLVAVQQAKPNHVSQLAALHNSNPTTSKPAKYSMHKIFLHLAEDSAVSAAAMHRHCHAMALEADTITIATAYDCQHYQQCLGAITLLCVLSQSL